MKCMFYITWSENQSRPQMRGCFDTPHPLHTPVPYKHPILTQVVLQRKVLVYLYSCSHVHQSGHHIGRYHRSVAPC